MCSNSANYEDAADTTNTITEGVIKSGFKVYIVDYVNVKFRVATSVESTKPTIIWFSTRLT